MAKHGFGSLAAFLDSLQADVVAIQEHKLTSAKCTKELALIKSGWETYWAFASTGYSGTLTAVKKGSGLEPVASSSEALDPEFDSEGRCVVTHHGAAPGSAASPAQLALTIVNVYTPNGGERPARARLEFKLRFLHRLEALVTGLRSEGRPVILLGDLNMPRADYDAFWTSADPPRPLGYGKEELSWMERVCGAPDPASAVDVPAVDWHGQLSSSGSLLAPELRVPVDTSASDSHSVSAAASASSGAATVSPLVDSFRECHPRAAGAYTVWDQRKAARTTNQGVRIDYVLVDRALRGAIRGSAVLYTPPVWSDHVAVATDIAGLTDMGASTTAGAKRVVPIEAAERWKQFRPAGKALTSFFSKAPAATPKPTKRAATAQVGGSGAVSSKRVAPPESST